MPDQFYHGVEVVEIDDGSRPIETVKSSVIGLIGTAPEPADEAAFPLDTPVLVAGKRSEAAKLGTKGTLPQAVDGIFDQTGAMIVVVRVAEGAGEDEEAQAAATLSNVIGGVDSGTGKQTGLQAFLGSKSVLGVQPRIIVAPGFSQEQAAATEMIAVCERLKAVCFLDGPNTTDAAAIDYVKNFSSPRAMVIDPWVTVWDTAANTNVAAPASARAAGILARMDNEKGWWWSPSNQAMNGIVGTARPVDFAMGDANCRANYLNENKVATVIREDGWRLWGNRSCSSDPKWKYLCVRRTADMINESLLQAHLWAVDRGITKTYVEDVRAGVESYLRHLKAIGAILGGSCWCDPELNAPDQIAGGTVYWDFDFTPIYPCEHPTFRSHLVNDYVEEIF